MINKLKIKNELIEIAQKQFNSARQDSEIEELKLELQILKDLPDQLPQNQREVVIGALVYILFNQQKKYYYIAPTAGGTMLRIDHQVVLVISVFSPIGNAILGLAVGDFFEIGEREKKRQYQILEIS